VRYFFMGDLEPAITPVLEEIERRLSAASGWATTRDRIVKVGRRSR
jgi:hypothetical protein